LGMILPQGGSAEEFTAVVAPKSIAIPQFKVFSLGAQVALIQAVASCHHLCPRVNIGF